MSIPTPYGNHLAGADPVAVLQSSFDEYQQATSALTRAQWEQPWEPGKWTLRQIMLHVTQWEMFLGYRVRCAAAVPGFVIQPLDQDPFMDLEDHGVDAATILAAFSGVRALNIALAKSLTPETRARVVRHPERGEIDVNDLLVTLAGHGVHHLKQIRATVT